MIFALLQLKNGRINLGSRSLRRPRTGLRKTATRSELEASGARSPTKIEYSFGNDCVPPEPLLLPELVFSLLFPLPLLVVGVDWAGGETVGVMGVEEAQLRMNGLFELGIMTCLPSGGLLICCSTAAAC